MKSLLGLPASRKISSTEKEENIGALPDTLIPVVNMKIMKSTQLVFALYLSSCKKLVSDISRECKVGQLLSHLAKCNFGNYQK